MGLKLSFIAICVLAAAPVTATPPNILLNASLGAPFTHVNPVVRSDGKNMVAVWMDLQHPSSQDPTEPRVHYAVSTDSGATFSDVGPLPTPILGSNTWRWRGDPQLVLEPASGAFYVLGQGSATSGTPSAGLIVAKITFQGGMPVVDPPFVFRWGMAFPAGQVGTLAFEASGGWLHVLCMNGGNIEYHRSNDGLIWLSQVILSSVADAGKVMFPRLVGGPGNQVYAAWAAGVGEASEPIRLRTSADIGQSWGAEQTVAVMHMNPVVPGGAIVNIGAPRTGFSMALNRAAGSVTHGWIGLAWGETWDCSDEPFSNLTQTVFRDEVEPDDDPSGAVPFQVGDALRGTLDSEADLDCWKVSLAAGDAIQFWGDSTAIQTVAILLSSDDGTLAHLITIGFSGPLSSVFTFRAPTAGAYYLRVQQNVGIPVGSYYRIRTRSGAPAAGEARDARDIATASFMPGGVWSIKRFAFGPVGYDDFEPTIGFGADGLDYVTWYDTSRQPGFASRSQLVVARNLAGNDAVASPPVVVSDVVADWSSLSLFFPPGVGCANSVSSDTRRVCLAWMDGRNGNPDAYAATVATAAELGPCPGDVTVRAGHTANVTLSLNNHNPLFDEKAIVHAFGTRAWPGPISVRDSVPPATNGLLHFPIAVPDTAAVGTYVLTLGVYRQSGIPLGTCDIHLIIQSPLAVEGSASVSTGIESIVPNPTRGQTEIRFGLASEASVRVVVYGIRGERVRTLANGRLPAGNHVASWDGTDDAGHRVAAGMYFVRMEGAGGRGVRPLVLLW